MGRAKKAPRFLRARGRTKAASALYRTNKLWYNVGKCFTKERRYGSTGTGKNRIRAGADQKGAGRGCGNAVRAHGQDDALRRQRRRAGQARGRGRCAGKLCQDLKGIHSYRAGSNGYAWVCRIVRNTALNDLRKSGGAEEWTVCGSLCTTADVLVKNLPLTGAKEGDVFVFSKAGAYSVTEGISLFLSRPLPRVYQREGETLTLLRDFIKTSQINQKE